jgi:hypothetical protein
MVSIQRFGLILGFSFLTLPGMFASEVCAQTLEVVSLDPVVETSQSTSGENATGQVFAEFSSPEESAADRPLANPPSLGENATGRIFADLSQLNQLWLMGTEIAPDPNEQQDPLELEGSIQTTVPDSSALTLSDASQEGKTIPDNSASTLSGASQEEEGTTVPGSSALGLSGASQESNSFSTEDLVEAEGDRASEPSGTPATEGEATSLVASQASAEDATASPDRPGSPTSETEMASSEADTAATRDRSTAEPAAPSTEMGDSVPEDTPPFTESELPEPVSVPEPSVSLFAWLGLAAAGLISTRVR